MLTAGGANATVLNATTNSLNILLPPNVFGNVSVQNTVNGLSGNNAPFAVPPSIPSISALVEGIGQTLTIQGAGFEAGTTVAFNGVPATTVNVVSPTTINVTIPSNTSDGSITVNTPNGTDAIAPFTLGMRWTQATAAAPFTPRNDLAMVTYNNKMWVMAGGGVRNDVWSSSDGTNWTEETLGSANLFPGRSYHAGAVWNPPNDVPDRGELMWVSGGYNWAWRKQDVWSSPDGKNWTEETAGAVNQLDFIDQHSMVTYDPPNDLPDRGELMWIIGGHKDNCGLPGGFCGPRVSKVWWSDDGKEWNLATGAAAFGNFPGANGAGRANHTSVVFNNKMWVIGGVTGADSSPDAATRNDVWWSDDGVNWNLATASAAFPPLNDHAAVVYNNKIWVMGGNSPICCGPRREVWSSGDGINWKQETLLPTTGFNNRTGHASTVYNQKIWVTGGWNGVSFNNVWFSP